MSSLKNVSTKISVSKSFGYAIVVLSVIASVVFGDETLWWWVGISILGGVYDAVAFSIRDFDKTFVIHPHKIAYPLRVIIAMALIRFTYLDWGMILADIASFPYSQFIIKTLALGLIFSLWHNGAYYEGRRVIDAPKNYWFFGYSSTSKTKVFHIFKRRIRLLEFGPIVRMVLFAIGLVLYNL